MRRKHLLTILGLMLFMPTGCVSAADAVLNAHNAQAAARIQAGVQEEAPHREDLLQAATDIQSNSQALERALGTPDRPVTYSPEASAAAREESRQYHDATDQVTDAFKGLISEKAPWLLTVIAALGWLWQRLKNKEFMRWIGNRIESAGPDARPVKDAIAEGRNPEFESELRRAGIVTNKETAPHA
jgi:hypothetical protein